MNVAMVLIAATPMQPVITQQAASRVHVPLDTLVMVLTVQVRSVSIAFHS